MRWSPYNPTIPNVVKTFHCIAKVLNLKSKVWSILAKSRNQVQQKHFDELYPKIPHNFIVVSLKLLKLLFTMIFNVDEKNPQIQ